MLQPRAFEEGTWEQQVPVLHSQTGLRAAGQQAGSPSLPKHLSPFILDGTRKTGLCELGKAPWGLEGELTLVPHLGFTSRH